MKNFQVRLVAFSILFLLFSITAIAQVQWINGPNGGSIKDIVEHKGSHFAMSNSKIFSSDDNAQNWQELDMSFLPFNVALFEFGTNKNYLFIRASTGLFRSGNSGNSWELIRSSISRVCIYDSIAFIYSSLDNRVYRSQDNGDTWVQKHSPVIDNTPSYDIGEFSFNGNLLFLGSVNAGTALYRSDDLGETWVHITSGLEMPDNPLYYIGPKQALFIDNAILLATWFGIYQSINDGLSWEPLLYDTIDGCQQLLKSGNLIIAKGYNETHWRSADGTNWVDITNNIPLSINTRALYSILPYNISYSANGTDNKKDKIKRFDESSHLFSTGSGIHISEDDLNTSYPSDNSGLVAWPTEPSMVVADESFVYVSAGGRIFKTNDEGYSWEKIYEGLNILRKSNNMMWGFSGSSEEYVHYSLDGGLTWYIIYGNNVYFSEDGGLTWIVISSNGPAGSITWMAELDGNIFCTALGGVYKSVDEGITWVRKTGMLNFWKIYATETSLFANCISDSDRGIHRSTDSGETWTNIGLGEAIYFNWDFIDHNGSLFIGVDYTSPRGVWRSTNNGDTWEHVHTNSKFRKFSSNGSKIYFSAYDPNSQKYPIYMSANNGNTWTEIMMNSENIFAVDSLYIYISNANDQILRSNNNGQSWENISEGHFMFRPRINGIVAANQGLFVGTMRSGYYVSSLIESSATVNTLFADEITENSAILYGTVNANGSNCAVTFEYGLTTSYGNLVEAEPSNVSGNAPLSVMAVIEGLSPNSTYNFRTVASNTNGVYYGPNKTFTTTIVGLTTLNNSKMKIYPNPFNDRISFTNTGELDRLIVKNIFGQKVVEYDLNGRVHINTSAIPGGLYLFIFIDKAGNQQTHRMVKQ